ncbi:bifunctional tetrahydrofolate synthase/dihydrofolate synthase [Frateuria aurantia]
MPNTLSEWLEYQQQTHPNSIELGLARVREVWQRMGSPRAAAEIITVGGTNGKGSTVAMLDTMLRASGYRVGTYTSPHLIRYNERIRIQGEEAGDAALVAAFERIEQARAGLPLTYFEFGTLAALDLLARAQLDVAVLEVGLGGRLDAINIVDADIAVVTTVDLDHMDWLGPDRDSIGREKAGIARAGRPLIIGDHLPPQGLLQAAAETGAEVWRIDTDFGVQAGPDDWDWWSADRSLASLPTPALAAPVQRDNAATAIAALHARDRRRPEARPWVQPEALAEALRTVRIQARLQRLDIDSPGPEVYLDVAHNPQAAASLARWLQQTVAAPVQAVYGALADKDVAGVFAALGDHIEHWHLVGLDPWTPRGLPAAALAEALRRASPQAGYTIHPDLATAVAAARQAAALRDEPLVLAMGSFYIAGEMLKLYASAR